MNQHAYISSTEMRKRLFELIKSFENSDSRYIITQNGKPKAVMLSFEAYDNLLDDLDIYTDSNLLHDIKIAEDDYKSGKYRTYPTLEEVVASQGLVIADKGDGNYDIQRRPATKSSKAAK